jgi:hypothetical protein
MDLLKGLIFLLSFYICLSTAAIVSGIEELEEFEEGKIQLTFYFVLFVCLVSSTNKTDHHEITEILLKVALSINQPT